MRYAIVMMCILNYSYVIGACIAGWTHKKMLEGYILEGVEIERVIMCDDYIYSNYGKLLKKYFDVVKKIKLKSYNFNSSGYSKKWKNKYSNWIDLSINKWQFMKYIEYDKILFLDIDILPISYQFYDLFKLKTPAFNLINIRQLNKWHEIEKGCYDGKPMRCKFDNYKQMIEKMDWSINGGIVLLKPSKKKYKKYYKFIKNEYKVNMYSNVISGPDETSLLYYFSKKFYRICTENAVVPWDVPEYLPNSKAINYLSNIKPWIKPTFYSWKEELLWRDIWNIMPRYKNINTLFNQLLLEGAEKCKNNINDINKKYLNMVKEPINTLQDIYRIEKNIIRRKKEYGIINIKDLQKIFNT